MTLGFAVIIVSICYRRIVSGERTSAENFSHNISYSLIFNIFLYDPFYSTLAAL